MKRVLLAIMSGLLLSCQGPAAVLAHEATAAAGAGAPADQYRAAVGRPSFHPKPHGRHHDLSRGCAALATEHDAC